MKIRHPKTEESSNHHFSGAMAMLNFSGVLGFVWFLQSTTANLPRVFRIWNHLVNQQINIVTSLSPSPETINDLKKNPLPKHKDSPEMSPHVPSASQSCGIISPIGSTNLTPQCFHYVGTIGRSIFGDTPPKIYMWPKNWWLVDVSPFARGCFQVPC